MNTVLKRIASSAFNAETVANNIQQLKHRKINSKSQVLISGNKNSSSNKRKNKNSSSSSSNNKVKKSEESNHVNKRHKKTHYNEHMEPITLKESTKNVSSSDYIPKRIREVVWNTYNGEMYSSKCNVMWCQNQINVFNYQVGHDVPDSKGGTFHIHNLRPICCNCNLSMGNKYTIQEWNKLINANHANIKDDNAPGLTPSIEPKEDARIQQQLLRQKQHQHQHQGLAFLTIIFLALNTMIF